MVEPIKQRVEQGHSEPAKPPVVVKKYANRRLYNTEASSYVTLEDLAEMVRQGRDFVVYDAKSGDDITRGVLTQIIVEEEAKGRSLLPTSFLRQLIGFYGDSLQSVLPRYLEFAMGSFARQQEQMRVTMEGLLPFGGLEEVGKQNLAMMERAMSLFAPFPQNQAGQRPAEPSSAEPGPEGELEAVKAELEEMKRQMAAMRATKGPKPV